MVRPSHLLLLPALLALSACDSKQLSGFDIKKLLDKTEGPQISGVEQTLLNSAKTAETQGNYAVARQYYQQLLDRAPQNADYAYGLAESLRRVGELDGAIQVYNQIIATKPGHVDALEGKGLAQVAKADMEGASLTFAEVMKQDAGRWRTLNAIGVLFAAKKMYAEGLQYFNAALARSPNNPTILNNMGLVAALDRDTFTAANKLEKAAAATLNNDQRMKIEMNTALVYAISGDMKKAEVLARKYLSGAQLSNNLGLYAHLAKDDALAKSYLNMALTESKVYYERAWDNLQNVQAPREAATTTPKRLVIQ